MILGKGSRTPHAIFQFKKLTRAADISCDVDRTVLREPVTALTCFV